MRESIWVLAFFSFIILFAFFLDLWRGKIQRGIHWWLYVIMTGSFVHYLFWMWRWDLFSYYLRFLTVIIFFAIAIISLRRSPKPLELLARPGIGQPIGPKPFVRLVPPLLYLLVAIFFNISLLPVYYGYSYEQRAVQLKFPLRDGVYYVAHGGSSELINYHYGYRKQRFAVDFMKLNAFGLRAWGWTPDQLKDYEIYRETVYSPCTGRVVKAVDSIRELPPLTMNPQTANYRKIFPTGNHVTIDCQGVRIVIAHLAIGSVRVKSDQKVTRGVPIGQTGNSGNTSEPHLHIHAERNGVGVPILFDGRFLIRNSLYLAD